MNVNSFNSKLAGYGLDIWGTSRVQFSTEEKLFSFANTSRLVLGSIHSLIQWVWWYGVLFPWG
jgi:hypothetical protein